MEVSVERESRERERGDRERQTDREREREGEVSELILSRERREDIRDNENIYNYKGS